MLKAAIPIALATILTMTPLVNSQKKSAAGEPVKRAGVTKAIIKPVEAISNEKGTPKEIKFTAMVGKATGKIAK